VFCLVLFRSVWEDFAIAKMQILAAAGVPTRDMYLTLVRDLRRQEDHAVLVVRVGQAPHGPIGHRPQVIRALGGAGREHQAVGEIALTGGLVLVE
jgi:hypothetical protein